MLPLDDRQTKRLDPVTAGRPSLIHDDSQIFFADRGRSDETTDIGYESGTSVNPAYTAHSSEFTGKIYWVQRDVGKDNYDPWQAITEPVAIGRCELRLRDPGCNCSELAVLTGC